MPEFKIDEKDLLARIERAAGEAQKSVRQTSEAAMEDVRQVVRAAAEMPARTDDLIAHAAHAWVKEFELKDDSREVRLIFDHLQVTLVNWQDGPETTIAPGRYRAIVVLVPVKGGR